MSLDQRLQLLAINNNKSATEVMIEYINVKDALNQTLPQYKNKQSRIKYFAFKQVESYYKR